MKRKIVNDGWKVCQAYGNVETRGVPPHRWLDGIVATAYGLVDVYADDNVMKLDFIFRSRLYRRQIEPSVKSTRSLVRFANAFAREIASGGKGHT